MSRGEGDSGACRFSDEEIATESKHMNTGWIEEVWISIPHDALSKTDSSVVYYDPSLLRDPIKQALAQDKEKKVRDWRGEVSLSVSSSMS